MSCPNCGYHLEPVYCPPEPPVGTWMRDRFGGTTMRQAEGWGQPGVMPFGKWTAMWEARGPYVECGPWGAELPKPTTSQVRASLGATAPNPHDSWDGDL